MAISRKQYEEVLALYGEPLPKKQWQAGIKVIDGYVGQLETALARARGEQPLFDLEGYHV